MKSSFALFLVAALIFILGVLLGVLLSKKLNISSNLTYPSPKACTAEAKVCPDGSSVGRSGPKCEFSKCPGE